MFYLVHMQHISSTCRVQMDQKPIANREQTTIFTCYEARSMPTLLPLQSLAVRKVYLAPRSKTESCWAKSRSFRGGSAPLHINSSELRKTSRQIMFCWHVLPHFVSFHFSHFIILDSFPVRLHGKLQRIPPKCHNSTCQNKPCSQRRMWNNVFNSCNVDSAWWGSTQTFEELMLTLPMILETSF